MNGQVHNQDTCICWADVMVTMTICLSVRMYRILIAALIVEFSHLLFYFFVILISATFNNSLF